jgi:hypothetical protein
MCRIRVRSLTWSAAALISVLGFAGDLLAQGQQTGGGGSLTGGGSGFTGGGGFSGGGTGFVGGSSTRNQYPGVMQGFRPLATRNTGGFRSTSQFGQQFGGGQFGGGQFGQFGGNIQGGGLLGRTQQGLGTVRISGASVAETLKYPPPPVPEIQIRIEKLLNVSAGTFDGRKLVFDLEGENLVLRGTVRNEYEKQLTESLVRLEPGVRNVKNELAVTIASPPRTESPPGPAPPPATPGGGTTRPP